MICESSFRGGVPYPGACDRRVDVAVPAVRAGRAPPTSVVWPRPPRVHSHSHPIAECVHSALYNTHAHSQLFHRALVPSRVFVI